MWVELKTYSVDDITEFIPLNSGFQCIQQDLKNTHKKKKKKKNNNKQTKNKLAQSDVPPPGVQTVAGSILGSGETFFHGDLVMKSFLRLFSPYR